MPDTATILTGLTGVLLAVLGYVFITSMQKIEASISRNSNAMDLNSKVGFENTTAIAVLTQRFATHERDAILTAKKVDEQNARLTDLGHELNACVGILRLGGVEFKSLKKKPKGFPAETGDVNVR